MTNNNNLNSITCTAPINIAVIKYWGKRDNSLILPTNSSLSVTLLNHCSKTTITKSPDNESDAVLINGTPEPLSKRFQNILNTLRSFAADPVPVHITSENNFPTAAGLASSASGMAALTFTLAKFYNLSNLSIEQLSSIARVGSGSACRSLMGGFVEWEMGSDDQTGKDSLAKQIAPKSHWDDMRALICVVNAGQKEISSTIGMNITTSTSTLFKQRLVDVPQRLTDIKDAIHRKDFEAFGRITMDDSNSFHACCLDSKPPIFYLTDVSRRIIGVVERYNTIKGEIRAAYTFDAGPNAVVYTLEKWKSEIEWVLRYYFLNGEIKDHDLIQLMNLKTCPAGVSDILVDEIGDGPQIIQSS